MFFGDMSTQTNMNGNIMIFKFTVAVFIRVYVMYADEKNEIQKIMK